MATITKSATLLGGLFMALALTAASAVAAAEGIMGYRSAEFGMSSEAVLASLESDEIAKVDTLETDDQDLIVDAELQGADGAVTDVRYVFPAGSDRLALVVTFHPDVADHAEIKEQLVSRYGQPWGEQLAEWWFEQLKEGMPEPPNSLSVWGGGENEQHDRGRFVRLWVFDDYLSVEYLDTSLFH